MASVRKEFSIDAAPAEVGAVLADFHAVQERLAPGFATSSRPDSDQMARMIHKAVT